MAAVALQGDLDQKNRDQVLVRFASRSATVLVATDVAARGLDIEAVDLTSRLNTVNEIFEVTTKPMIFDADTGGIAEHFAFTVNYTDTKKSVKKFIDNYSILVQSQ